jgi:hypothetical protein
MKPSTLQTLAAAIDQLGIPPAFVNRWIYQVEDATCEVSPCAETHGIRAMLSAAHDALMNGHFTVPGCEYAGKDAWQLINEEEAQSALALLTCQAPWLRALNDSTAAQRLNSAMHDIEGEDLDGFLALPWDFKDVPLMDAEDLAEALSSIYAGRHNVWIGNREAKG